MEEAEAFAYMQSQLPSHSVRAFLATAGKMRGEFLSPCRVDSSPRSKTVQGPNPILRPPPPISPSLPPSGPDYSKSGTGITPLHPEERRDDALHRALQEDGKKEQEHIRKMEAPHGNPKVTLKY
uniref:Uncharacterized protein n=1 Tax=Knipowitschia caucasica TaxID=637954 RepID=A0AAV2JKC0_KNICA